MIHKVLILGLGIGFMYKRILENSSYRKYKVITFDIDPNKKADYTDLSTCLETEGVFDMSIIALPNFLHKEYAEKMIGHSNLILVEKPGFKNKEEWKELLDRKAPIVMIKNNMFRTDFLEISSFLEENKDNIRNVVIKWQSKDRVPRPGSWFTTKELAFGGVSRDIMPHLMSIYYHFYNTLYPEVGYVFVYQNWNLELVEDSSYGEVNKNGTYDVDDNCSIDFFTSTQTYPVRLIANWKQPLLKNDLEIDFNVFLKDGSRKVFDLGLCPEMAYDIMFHYFVKMSEETFNSNNEIDLWIHDYVEQLSNFLEPPSKDQQDYWERKVLEKKLKISELN